ncbi:hypothetical protein OIDMADRAFT_49453 [Oidiodendron maius Zn]|uniref:Uncharacterized protein n=1 Tax=Oidiodendron maius (strain Zn) TaxID=913774 RepID=A0A0C3HCB6_OIDMZ|nr:hypothetical protein OIDMADRAFT_49453 [Oidiodendron maius Zn]
MRSDADPANSRALAAWADLSENEKPAVGRIVSLTKRTREPDAAAVGASTTSNYYSAAMGIFSRDLPAVESQLEEFGSSAREVYKAFPNTPRKSKKTTEQILGGEAQPQRLKGAPAFIKVHVGGTAKCLNWLWIDSASRAVNQSYIEFFNGQPLESFIKDAIIQYDSAELPRLCQWNSKLAVYIVRRRIKNWTENGYPSAVGGEDELIARFEEIVLCQDLLPIYAQLAQQVKEDGGDNGLTASTPRFTVSL